MLSSMNNPPLSSRPRLFVTLCASLLLTVPAFAEQNTSAAAPAEQHSILQLIWHGGPLTVLIWVCLVLTSVTMVTFIIQNILYLRNDKLAPQPLFDSLKQTLASGNYQEAWEICKANRAYVANVLKAGLERLGRGKEAVQEGLAEHGLREAQILRTRNSYLSVIGVVAPMIGLLGTVIGMMRAFATLASSGIKDPSKLAANISEVLLATASGLFIAIPAFICYYIFRNRAQMVIVHADDKLNELVQDIPYEELAGIRIGESFSAAAPGSAPEAALSRKVSMALTTNCPVCNSAISAGITPCPHCQAALQWS